ncbi:hypothetical protein D3C77_487370 [compost metagenome]
MQRHRQGQLFFQGLFLLRARRKVAVEVQPAFTYGLYPGLLEQGAQVAVAVAVPAAGIVGVDAGGAEQALAALIQCLAQFQGLFAAFKAGASDHHLHHTRRLGAFKNGRMFVGKTWIGQIDADVDELHGATSGRKPASIAKLEEFR